MSQSSSDKFLHFTVGLLKDSEALESLRQDAVKHHMIDNPGQLIALRLTEYYEMMNKGIVQPVVSVPAVMTPVASEVKPQSEADAQVPSYKPAPVQPAQQPVQSYQQSARPAPMPAYESGPVVRQPTGRMRAIVQNGGENVVSTSSNADQNADDAADYWSLL
ncbi:hypothetical protein [Dictyobacter aurantiacus]|uniref:Uncharacterized protein n=1 Tax=Dictyobacter aurantiacus TaxID=1936993 RepID=A0A401ZSB7_9CHLR|nr:hypothetical protein [Dictyobacter aurantiacus]GCE09743.1 hypothetical protein KDAU_70720 [Dictyobacter aurantiacus]